MKSTSLGFGEDASRQARDAERTRVRNLRQAEALRLNLKRRKDQSKARATPSEECPADLPDVPETDLV